MGLKAFCVIAGVVVTGAFLLPTAHAQTSLQQALKQVNYPANTPFPSNFLDNSTLANSTILLPPTESQWAQIVNQTNGTANYYFLRNLNLAVDGTGGGGLVVNTLLPGYNINVANSSQFWYVYGEAVPAVRADKSQCVPFGEGNSSSVCRLKRVLTIANTSVYDYLTTQPNLSMMVELIDSWPNLKTEYFGDVDDAGVVVAPNNTAFMTWMNETGQNFTTWKSSPEAQQFLENSIPVFWDNGPFQGRLDILEVATNELGQPPQALYYYNATGGATRDNIIFLPDVPKNRQGVAAKILSGEPVPYGKNYVIVVDAVPVASNLTASDFGEKNSTAPSPAPSPGPGESPAPGTAGGPPGAESPALIVVGPTTTPSPPPSPGAPGSSPRSTAAPLSMVRWSITGLAGAAALCLALL